MKIATWNVNSIRVRMPRLLEWLERARPETVCLQETKVVDEEFPTAELHALGYDTAFFGQKTYNGVAILSRYPLSDVMTGLPDDPPDADRRVIAATAGGVRVLSVYVPNGRQVGSEHYAFKLHWLDRLRRSLAETHHPTTPLALCGDFNIAPEDRDVWDPELWRGQNLFSEPEKQALRELLAWGLEDTLRRLDREAGVYTWWDYRQGAFHRGWGLRIDHILATPPLAARCTEVQVERHMRKGVKPSDHAPVVASFDIT